MQNRSHIIDLINLVFLFLCAAIFAAVFVDFDMHPIEDAAMLMRYSKHFAEGHGIVWNIGEAPVDGATDFLFMIAIGLLVKMGLALEFSTRFLGFAAHFLTMGVVFMSLRRTFDAPRLIASGSALFLLAGPGFFYVVAYFGTTVFALFASISWWLALDIIEHGESARKSLLFSFASLITGLIRPEGVPLTALMLLVILFIRGGKSSRATLISYASIFLIVGGAYFLWRWSYFGYPLPNPFYRKGGGVLYYDSLVASYAHTFFLNIWLLPAFVAGVLFRETRRRAIGFFALVFGFASLFILLTNNMNVLGRFQYVTLPLAAMVCWTLTQGVRRWLNIPDWTASSPVARRQLFFSALTVIFFAGAAKLQYGVYRLGYGYDLKYDAALMLAEYRESGYRLATSEAGLLPLYSGWKSLDTWGLNDQWIAHHGIVTEKYLGEFDPHIIMFHAFFSPGDSTYVKDDWNNMAIVLKTYAEQHGYILAVSYEKLPHDTEYYYVRPDFPESAEIIRRIQEIYYPDGVPE